MENILEIENLNISFSQYYKGLKRKVVNVVKDLNLNVKTGEVLAIFGASGSGKSLLVHSILNLLPENALVSGSIKYQGRDLNRESLKDLRGSEISFIPQTINSLNPLIKIGKQVRNGIKNKDKSVEIQEELFARFGLDKEVSNLYPFELSGGMARKALFCTAMANDAKLIIADEPTPGMDDIGLDETVKFFRGIANNNGSVIMITHDMDTALKIADRIAIFYNGTIIEVALKEAFSLDGEKLNHPYSKALWQALPQNGFSEPTKVQLDRMKEYEYPKTKAV